MSKKFLASFLAVAMALGLAACGQNTPSSGNDTNTPASEATATAGEPTASPEPQQPVDLVVLYEGALNCGAGKLEEVIAKKGEELKTKASGNDGLFQYEFSKYLLSKAEELNVNVTYEDWGWAEPLMQKETAAFLAGQGPDVIVGETQMPGYAAQGVLEPFPDWLDQEIRENIVPGAWKPMEYQGKIYGIAAQPGVNILVWNKDILEKAGIDDAIIEAGPKTWDELLDISKKVADAGKGDFFPGGCYAGPNAGGYLRFGAFMQISGGGFVNENNEPIFNSENNIPAFEFLRASAKLNPSGYIVNAQEAGFFDPFAKGQVAFCVDGPWRIQISNDTKMNCGFGPLPVSKDGKPGNVTIGAAFMSVPTYSKNKDAAFKYIQAHVSKEGQSIVADYKLRPVVNKQIGETDEYRLNNPELYDTYEELKGNVVGLPTYNKDNTKAWQVLGDAMVKAALTDTPVKDILDEAQAKVEQIVK